MTESMTDLRSKKFLNKAVTAKVTGDCCWKIYADTNFSGKMITLEPDKEYTSGTSLEELFRNVESVKKSVC